MTKTLALIAALGLVAAPAFAQDAAKPAVEKVVKAEPCKAGQMSTAEKPCEAAKAAAPAAAPAEKKE